MATLILQATLPLHALASAATVSEVLRLRAQMHGERIACTYLLDGESKEDNLTYRELDLRASAVAAALHEANAAGKPVLLLLPTGLEFVAAFFGCLYAGAIAVPYFPPLRRKQLLRAIVNDSHADLALICAERSGVIPQDPDFESLRSLDISEILAHPKKADPQGLPGPESVAYLQYTSASTRAPRGVAIRNAEILRHTHLIWRAMGQDEQSVAVSWLPLFHDMGLIGTLITPLVSGIRTILLSPLHFMRKPERWLQCISRYRATSSGAPNFAYEICAREQTRAACRDVDLSSWTLAFCGAEAIRPATLGRFYEAYAPSGFRHEAFYPCYGLAEATLMVTGGHLAEPLQTQSFDREALNRGSVILSESGAPGAAELVSCGHAWGNEPITIVDPETLVPCPAAQVGEIWVGSGSLTNTYWGNPDESERVFRAYTAAGAGPFLRTGDLGLLHEGQLFITGRLKDLIIVRGVNHYSHDIEYALRQCHPALQHTCTAAFTVERTEREELIIVQELPRGRLPVAIEVLEHTINAVLFDEFGLAADEVLFTAPGAIPRTSSGKMMRYACRQQFLEGSLNAISDSPTSGN